MGFADFRAAFTEGTSSDWVIEPAEGSLMQREDTDFVIKYRPSSPGMSEGQKTSKRLGRLLDPLRR